MNLVSFLSVSILPLHHKHGHPLAHTDGNQVPDAQLEQNEDNDNDQEEVPYDEASDISKPPIIEAEFVHPPSMVDDVEHGHTKKDDTGDTSQKTSCMGKILQSYADDDGFVRLSSTTVLTIISSFVSAGIMYAIEHGSTCQWDFWQSLWFVNTLITSIGYGTLSPCTTGGRAATVIIALIGIPINLLALNDLGKLFARALNFLWKKAANCCRSCCKRGKNSDSTDPLTKDEDEDPAERDNAPLSIAVLVTVLWFALTAGYFSITEPSNMDYPTAIYYVMVSVTTIGLGDVDVSHFDLVIPQFFFIIVGMALFSMCIKIVQEKVDKMEDQVEDMIKKEYAQSQQTGAALTEGDSANHAKDHINNLVKQQGGGLLRFAMGKDKENKLLEDFMDKAKLRVVGVQTDNNVRDKHVMAVTQMKHNQTQTESKQNCKCDEPVRMEDKGTQLRLDVASTTRLEWLDLTFTPKKKEAKKLYHERDKKSS